MYILYGTKETSIEPVAVFETMPLLSSYVNTLTPSGASEIDPVLQAQSVLADCTDHQTVSVAQIWSTREDWIKQLEAAKLCPFNPMCSVVSRGELEAKRADLQAQRDELDAKLVDIQASLAVAPLEGK